MCWIRSVGRYRLLAAGLMVMLGWGLLVEPVLAQPAMGDFIYLQVPEETWDVYFSKEVQLPQAGKILRAWTAAAAHHEFTLSINGREVCRSRYGRTSSAFRLAEEIGKLCKILNII